MLWLPVLELSGLLNGVGIDEVQHGDCRRVHFAGSWAGARVGTCPMSVLTFTYGTYGVQNKSYYVHTMQ